MNPRPRLIPLLALVFLLLTTRTLRALEATGAITSLDTRNNILQIYANGRNHSVAIAPDVQVLAADGQPLPDGLKSAQLKPGAVISITADPGPAGPVVRTIRLGGPGAANAPQGAANAPPAGRASVGFKPLTDMTAQDHYKGEDGGLYGAASNQPPPALLAAARAQTRRIVPLDQNGNPAPDGRIGLASISMSNATQEYSVFKQLADADPQKSPRVAIVDCAQGGQAMAEWADPAAHPWTEAQRRLAQADVSPNQVQVIWVKLANKNPHGDLAEHGRKLEHDTIAVLQNAKARFPYLRIAYLGSRIYGGYSGGPLNPEPYAYESAFAARWLIQDQIKGLPDLRYDSAGDLSARVPLLLWGPYFWADGVTPRAGDHLTWQRTDLGPDGTHPSPAGRQKVAQMLLKFFKEDHLARTWFLQNTP